VICEFCYDLHFTENDVTGTMVYAMGCSFCVVILCPVFFVMHSKTLKTYKPRNVF